ncbi:uncharacterized protein LOC131231891 [Magnolia sinica]|uniref:uncharacterized protein LOC131231891 n=1 Tax=Magnolia sinica TaxID=86752 RepID=UPI0026594852|nr:uncharacterized protein LOC131231891 [Magnolia sinica]
MISEVQRGGEGVQPPTAFKIMGKYLDDEHAKMKTYVDSYKQSWEMYGCTIMCDSWTGPTKMSVINFMVYCREQAVFLKSIDASNKIKDGDYIYKLMHNVMRDVGRRNIVQFVTDNGSAFVKAGKDIQANYHMYWTPCAAHCIDLMLEAIGDRPSVKTVITNARLITNFIYNHTWLLAAMRERYGGDIVGPGATRFATNYIALSGLLKHRQGLQELFASHDYEEWKKRLTKVTWRIEEPVLRNEFWDRMRNMLGILEPISIVLRMVDNETNPTMGSLYPSIQLRKEAMVAKAPNAYKWVHAIIHDRWEKTLSHPLHQAAYFLNHKYHYSRKLYEDNSLKRVVHEVYDHLYLDCTRKGTFVIEIVRFRDAVGTFGCHPAVMSRNTMMACELNAINVNFILFWKI